MRIFLSYLHLAVLALLFLLPNSIVGDCNVCSAITNVACVSDTQFQTCVGGYPSGPLNSCPTGYVCTADVATCQPNTASVAKACSGCNQCDSTNTFACTSARTFALCLGTPAISSIVGNCEPYHVCNVNYPQICGNATQGIEATCSFLDGSTTAATPTSSTPITTDPTAYCRVMKQNGRFPCGTSLTSSCRQYIYCYLLDGFWYGVLYTCPGSTYFNSSARLCMIDEPARCSVTVQSLQLNNLQLS